MAHRAGNGRGGGRIRLILTAGGKTARMPVLRDSGNLLRFGGGGLPVIAAPEKLIRPLLPPGTDLRDLATLPRGWRLIRLRTAAGEKTAVAFEPDGAVLMRGGKKMRVRLAVAVVETVVIAVVSDAFVVDVAETVVSAAAVVGSSAANAVRHPADTASTAPSAAAAAFHTCFMGIVLSRDILLGKISRSYANDIAHFRHNYDTSIP